MESVGAFLVLAFFCPVLQERTGGYPEEAPPKLVVFLLGLAVAIRHYISRVILLFEWLGSMVHGAWWGHRSAKKAGGPGKRGMNHGRN